MKNCPFNYAGSKSEYLEIHGLDLPMADLFGGGGGFWSNCASLDIVVNDRCTPLIAFQKMVYELSDLGFEQLIEQLREVTGAVDSRESYEVLRVLFNQTQDPIVFMAVLSCCTNNLIRFNQSGGFNQTWGQRRFSDSTEKKLRAFRERIRTKKIVFSSKDFAQIDVTGRVLFVDPPYLISTAGYNTTWTVLDEARLYSFLEGKLFLMTNFLQRGEMRNSFLEQAIERNKWSSVVIREGKMKAAKDDSIYQEVLVSSF